MGGCATVLLLWIGLALVGIPMRQFVLLIADIALMLLGTLTALILYENFELSEKRLLDFLPHLLTTAAVAAAVFSAAGLNRAVWRFSLLADYLRVVGAVATTVCVAAAVGFAYDRLNGVPLSLPMMQFLAGQALLLGGRAMHRWSHVAREERKALAALKTPVCNAPALTVLIVGISQLTEAYLRAATELRGLIKVAGLVGHTDSQSGRRFAGYPLIGVPEDIEHIVEGLAAHGIHPGRIVVATQLSALPSKAREALLSLKSSGKIPVQFLAENWGLEVLPCSAAGRKQTSLKEEPGFEIPSAELALFAARRYWGGKRALDAVAAFALLVACAPVMVLAAICVAISVGFPIMFWQQRPGLGGRPIQLYKFRTMRAPLSSNGRRLTDRERTTLAGNLLRRLRIDELPQLFSILRGDMSFVGPRPLLAREQGAAHRARLLVRPGLTGWAQVIGGRDISVEDKAALDVWYVRNATMALDLEIALRTIPMVLFGERVSSPLVEKAWNDLSGAGIIKGSLMNRMGHRLLEVPSQVQ